MNTVAVIGLGLIGGSIARDLSRLGIRVAGVDVAGTAQAVAAGVVDAEARVEDAEVVVLAVPVDVAPGVLHALGPRLARARLITDAGSTKRSILAAAAGAGIGAHFVGAHPLAGDSRGGWDAAREGLFAGARVILTPASTAADDVVSLATSFWSTLGAEPEIMDAATHDALLAWSSHLPQMVATALGCTLQSAGVARAALGPGGRDTTRLAGSPADLWTAIALDNADCVAPALRAMEERLALLREAVDARDAATVRGFLEEAGRWSAAW